VTPLLDNINNKCYVIRVSSKQQLKKEKNKMITLSMKLENGHEIKGEW